MRVKYEGSFGDDCFGTAPVRFTGEIEIPDDMWDRRQAGYRWSDEIADYIISARLFPLGWQYFMTEDVFFKNIDPLEGVE